MAQQLHGWTAILQGHAKHEFALVWAKIGRERSNVQLVSDAVTLCLKYPEFRSPSSLHCGSARRQVKALGYLAS